MTKPTDDLAVNGVSVWFDDLSRLRLRTGGLEALVSESGVRGVTTNPTIFAAAIAAGQAYRDHLAELALRGVGVDEAVRALTTYDVRWACDVLAPLHQQSSGNDGYVSIEVDPRLAHDAQRTVAEARALWWLVDRPNVLIKIPATPAGVDAVREVVGQGISVNVTLIFSLARYRQVIHAYLEGLELAQEQGRPLSGIASVASFFVSRVDAEIDTRLDKAGTPAAASLRGQAAIANARLAYELFVQSFDGERWVALEAAGARRQRPLWASTSVKDPSYPDTRYVTELVAAHVVNTMPEVTLRAVLDHADVRGDTITGQFEAARRVMEELAANGIAYDDVVDALERDGVRRFEDSYAALTATVTQSLSAGR